MPNATICGYCAWNEANAGTFADTPVCDACRTSIEASAPDEATMDADITAAARDAGMTEIVTFRFQGRTYRGPVTSKANWGPGRYDNGASASDWYVEFTHDAKSAGRTGDPGYVKEIPDGVSGLTFIQE